MNRKFLCLLSALLWLNSSNAMNFLKSSEPIITKPYTPSFIAQHPYIFKTVKAGAAGTLAYLAAHYLKNETSLYSPFVIGAAVGTGALMHVRNSKPRLLDALLANPLTALNHIYKVRDAFGKVAKKGNFEELGSEEQLTLYKNLTARYAKDCPLFWLGECRQEGWGACALSRTYQPEHRKLYEDAVIASLLEKTHNQESVNYTSFGCGGRFQDMVILTKTLCQNPNAHINIHLIDMNHTPYVAAQDFLHNTQRKVVTEQNTDITTISEQLVQCAREKWGANAKDADEKVINMLHVSITQIEIPAQQFIDYLHKTFPHATLSLHLHSSAQDYEQCLDTNNFNYPDVLTTADIEDEMSQLRSGPTHYVSLCKKTLERNPNSYNVWLNKENYTQAKLTTISLNDNLSNSKSFEFETDDKEKTILFFSAQEITKAPNILSRAALLIFG